MFKKKAPGNQQSITHSSGLASGSQTQSARNRVPEVSRIQTTAFNSTKKSNDSYYDSDNDEDDEDCENYDDDFDVNEPDFSDDDNDDEDDDADADDDDHRVKNEFDIAHVVPKNILDDTHSSMDRVLTANRFITRNKNIKLLEILGLEIKHKLLPRIIYTVITLLLMSVPPIISKFQDQLPKNLHVSYHHGDDDPNLTCDSLCRQRLLVYRVTSTLFCFHMFLFLATLGGKESVERQNYFKNSAWTIKFIMLLSVGVCFFYLPDLTFRHFAKLAISIGLIYLMIQAFLFFGSLRALSGKLVQKLSSSPKPYWGYFVFFLAMLLYLISLGSTAYGFFKTKDGPNGIFLFSVLSASHVSHSVVVFFYLFRKKRSYKKVCHFLFNSAAITAYSTYLVVSTALLDPDLRKKNMVKMQQVSASNDKSDEKNRALLSGLGIYGQKIEEALSIDLGLVVENIVMTIGLLLDVISATYTVFSSTRGLKNLQIGSSKMLAWFFQSHFAFHMLFAIASMHAACLLTKWHIGIPNPLRSKSYSDFTSTSVTGIDNENTIPDFMISSDEVSETAKYIRFYGKAITAFVAIGICLIASNIRKNKAQSRNSDSASSQECAAAEIHGFDKENKVQTEI